MSATWADECNGAAGTAPDSTLWKVETTQPWQPADQLQFYTTSTSNAYYNGLGQLVLKAIKQTTNGKPYSSAKLFTRKTDGTGRFRYGLFQARLSLPTATGIWPAFWLLGEDNLPELAWPRCGEVDVMEAPASASTYNQIHQGTHNANSSGNDVPVGVTPTSGSNWGDYHVYSVDWTPGQLDFYIDDKLTGSILSYDVTSAGGRWVYDRGPMSIILNLAVGGWAGTPDPAWTEQSMLVDWVRVYAYAA